MLRTLFLIVLSLGVALGGGIGAAWYVVDEFPGFNRLDVGQWTAWPNAGSPEADPYARARQSRDGLFPLGPAEGLAFTASRDAEGRPLTGNCHYRLEGETPIARLWTIFLMSGQPPRPVGGALHSRLALRQADGSIAIAIGPDARPGNWIRTGRSLTAFSVSMVFYDTSVADGSGLSEFRLPLLRRIGCDG
ncbi:MAG TPA: DUF1214 domain-containing protein [Rhizobiaceae bacterium]|nr:DUF1214 domain-containing protein [Rhizobiaceae bacterium]